MTVPEIDRAEPGRVGDERGMLEGWLDYYRASLLHKCSGLTAEQLVVRSCEPSPLSLVGLVRHMTEMERAHAHRLADRATTLLYCTDDDPDGDIAIARHHGRAPAGRYVRHDLVVLVALGLPLPDSDLLRERIDGVAGE